MTPMPDPIDHAKLADELREAAHGEPGNIYADNLLRAAAALEAKDEALRGLLLMVSAVLTDSQLDHVSCSGTIRNAIDPARAALDGGAA